MTYRIVITFTNRDPETFDAFYTHPANLRLSGLDIMRSIGSARSWTAYDPDGTPVDRLSRQS